MIGKLSGVLDEICSDHVVLMVGGIGYIIYISPEVSRQFSVGLSAVLYIEDVVTNDGLRCLYGFKCNADRSCFRLLVKISGVGYKTAMSILSSYTAEKIYAAISANKPEMIKVTGVGSKIVNRIIAELQGKVPVVIHEDSFNVGDALMALVSLGYDKSKAVGALNIVAKDNEGLTTQVLIRLALRELSQLG